MQYRRPRRRAAALIAAAVWLAAPLLAQPAPSRVSAESLMTTVRALSAPELRGRATGTEGAALARRYIRDRFEALKLEPLFPSFEQAFTFTAKGSSGDVVTGVNLGGVCTGTGSNLPAIVVTAHYDHLGERGGRIYPGADDNASGVAALLELAALCQARPFRHDLVVVAFDAEEVGLRGAEAFVGRTASPGTRFAVNVNLDMVARGDRGEIYIAGTHHYPALRALLEPVAATAPITVRFGHDLPGSGEDDWTLQSDHGAFHKAGVPFVYFGVEDHPDYHQPTDTADKINPDFFAKATGVVLEALIALDAGLN